MLGAWECSPQDKPRVERTVHCVKGSFFAGETFMPGSTTLRDWSPARLHVALSRRGADGMAVLGDLYEAFWR
jgi:hypothetical protein